MLHLNTINTKTLELLKKLQFEPLFHQLRLVGGTGLALQIGHRKSIDIVLFGKVETDDHQIAEVLNEIGQVRTINISHGIKIYSINDIKVDIVNYPYKWIQKPIPSNNLQLANIQDIAAMKLAAITNRGTKKDFIDLYFLLQQYSFKDIIGFYNKKYEDGSEFLLYKSILYFEDAEDEPMPTMIKNVSWENVKCFIEEKTKNHLN
jgi:predicted nucleotidyltransferase